MVYMYRVGSMVKPDKSSATFSSVVGNLDKRLELDKSINTGDSRYGASLSIMASTLSYENEAFVQNVVTDHWKVIPNNPTILEQVFSPYILTNVVLKTCLVMGIYFPFCRWSSWASSTSGMVRSSLYVG